ncbi:MAG: CDP-glucose 4,6-dehydratase [Sphingomonadaceae bacterium]
MPDQPITAATLPDYFSGKHVLVTGHTGFKGSWLSLWLHDMGAQVTGIALPPPDGPSLFNAVGLAEMIDHRVADITDPEAYSEACRDVDPDLVIHMAAQSLVRPSYDDPVRTFQTNVTGTAIVLDRARRMKNARGVIVVTSDKCYENHEWPWPYRETDQIGGADPYSASKGCAELVAHSFRQSFFSTEDGCQIASARAGNVIGGGDWAVDRLVPDIMRASIANTDVLIRNPDSVRPWQHVLEPLSGYLILGAHLMGEHAARYAQAWNFGPRPDAFLDVRTLARHLLSAWGEGAAKVSFGKPPVDVHEAGMLTLDSSKAASLLGWKPHLSTTEAIALAAQWYRAFANGADDMRAITRAQIAHFAGNDPEFPVPQTDPQTDKVAICA